MHTILYNLPFWIFNFIMTKLRMLSHWVPTTFLCHHCKLNKSSAALCPSAVLNNSTHRWMIQWHWIHCIDSLVCQELRSSKGSHIAAKASLSREHVHIAAFPQALEWLSCPAYELHLLMGNHETISRQDNCYGISPLLDHLIESCSLLSCM